MNIALGKWKSYMVKPGSRVRLRGIASDKTDFCADKPAARSELKRYKKQIDEIVRVLGAEEKRSLLVVLQGVDASGKDGTVRKVFTGVNPQYCRVINFKEPNREERAHDFLWRIYRSAPVKGELRVFNRSQYEDVLVPRAHGEIPAREAHERLRQIADIERAWAENGIVIRKFFLHISREEQTRRFEARLEDPEKHWKVQGSDFRDRKLWAKFQATYEDILTRTSSRWAPWYILPADHKWYRDVAVAGLVLGTLKEMRPQWPAPKLPEESGEIQGG